MKLPCNIFAGARHKLLSVLCVLLRGLQIERVVKVDQIGEQRRETVDDLQTEVVLIIPEVSNCH